MPLKMPGQAGPGPDKGEAAGDCGTVVMHGVGHPSELTRLAMHPAVCSSGATEDLRRRKERRSCVGSALHLQALQAKSERMGERAGAPPCA